MNGEAGEAVSWRQALGALNERGAPEEACPTPEAFWQAAAGTLNPQALRTLLDHTARCPPCLEAWGMAKELQGHLDEEAAVKPPPVRRHRYVSGWRYIAVATAAAVLVLAFGLRLMLPLEDDPAGTRGGDNPEIRSLLSETLPRDDFELRWSGPKHKDVRYNLRVTWASEQDLVIVDEVQKLETTVYRVSEAALNDVPSGTVLTWRVEAVRNGRKLVARSFLVTLASDG